MVNEHPDVCVNYPKNFVPLSKQFNTVETGFSGKHERVPISLNEVEWVVDCSNVLGMSLHTRLGICQVDVVISKPRTGAPGKSR